MRVRPEEELKERRPISMKPLIHSPAQAVVDHGAYATSIRDFNSLVSGIPSHHIPSEEAVHKNYKGDSFNRFFVSDLTGLIKEKKPRLWVYGHTHLPNRTLVGETDIVTNPYGYPQEREFFPEYEPVVMEI